VALQVSATGCYQRAGEQAITSGQTTCLNSTTLDPYKCWQYCEGCKRPHQTLVPLLSQPPAQHLVVSVYVAAGSFEIVRQFAIMALRSAGTQLLGRAGLLPAAVCNAFQRCMSTSEKFSVEVSYGHAAKAVHISLLARVGLQSSRFLRRCCRSRRTGSSHLTMLLKPALMSWFRCMS
jgi:hypothetical protein